MTVLRYAIPHSPWLAFPPDKPFNNVDRYLQEIAGVNWAGLRDMVAAFDPKLAKELDAAAGETDAEHRIQGRHIDPHSAVSNMRLTKGSTHRSYLLRRIARERPDILEAYARGEYSSARAAADAAGIPRDDAPLKILRRAWKRATPEQREEFVMEVIDEVIAYNGMNGT